MMKLGKKMLAAGACGVLAMGLLAGCAQQSGPKYDLVIGQETETTLTLAMTNGTGQAIDGFSFMESGGLEFPASLMAEGDAWEPDAVAQLFLEADVQEEVVGEVASDGEAAEGNTQNAEAEDGNAQDADVAAGDDVVLNHTYDMQFSLADGSVATLHGLVLSDLVEAEDLTLMIDEESGLAYLTYTEDGSEVSTLDAEKQFKEAQEAAAAAAAAEAEAQAQAAAEAAAQAAAAPDYGYAGGSYEPAGSGSVSQGSDSCVSEGDLVLN